MRAAARSRWAAFVSALLGVVLLLSMPVAAPGFSSKLRRYPYLTDAVGPFITVNWATDRSRKTGVVKWGRFGRGSCTAHATRAIKTPIKVNSDRQYQWKARLRLRPNARYCYRVYLGRRSRSIDLLEADASPRFRTQVPSGAGASFSFAVFGDWGAVGADGNPHLANVITRIAQSGARFAVTTGDNTTEVGTQANYGDLVQRGDQISAVFGPSFWKVAGASLPVFPAIGNHGHSNSNHLINWPQDRAVSRSRGRYATQTYCCKNGTQRRRYPSAWYAFDAGRARFYILHAAWSNSNVGAADIYKNDYDYHWTPGAAQYRWLRRDLRRHRRRSLKLAFLHFPIRTDEPGVGSDAFLQGQTGLEGLLGRYGVKIAFTSHAHVYQRNLPAFPGAPVTYVSGGGGDRLHPIGGRGCSPLDAYGIGWSYSANRGSGGGSACGAAPVPTEITQVFHFLLVTVDAGTVTVTPIDELGRSFDQVRYAF